MKINNKQYWSLTDFLLGDEIGAKNARQAADNEHARNMRVLDLQDSSDRRSYLYSVLALNKQDNTQAAELQNNSNRYQMIVIVAAIIGAVLIFKNI